jgi:hypothetical protein
MAPERKNEQVFKKDMNGCARNEPQQYLFYFSLSLSFMNFVIFSLLTGLMDLTLVSEREQMMGGNNNDRRRVEGGRRKHQKR